MKHVFKSFVVRLAVRLAVQLAVRLVVRQGSRPGGSHEGGRRLRHLLLLCSLLDGAHDTGTRERLEVR